MATCGCFLLLLTLAAAPEENVITGAKPAPGPAGPTGTFEGLLPCADCPGVQHRLTLSPDGSYHLRRKYQEKPNGTVDEVGSWALSSDGKVLALQGDRDGARYFSVASADRVTQLDTRGRPIPSAASLDLRRSASPAPIEPRLALEGLFRYMADAAIFEECRTRRKTPVAMEAAYLALEKAYTAKRDEAGQAVYAVVEGRIVERVNMEGPARPTLVVERFSELRPDETCPPRFANAPLGGTYWRLAELDGAPVPPEEKSPKREAHLVFAANPRRVAGADGCNALTGPYTLTGSKIGLGRLAGTLMACTETGDRDQRFRQALAKAASYRTLGPELQLLDAEGRLLARFEAVPRSKAVTRAR
jgi:copper homeostasis protein (lipoprotein)